MASSGKLENPPVSAWNFGQLPSSQAEHQGLWASCYNYCPRVSNFTSFRSTTSLFQHYKLKCSPYVLTVSMIPKFHSVSLYDQPFSRYRPFWDKYTEWPQNDLEHYQVICAPYICYQYPWVPNFTRFRSMMSRFRSSFYPCLSLPAGTHT